MLLSLLFSPLRVATCPRTASKVLAAWGMKILVRLKVFKRSATPVFMRRRVCAIPHSLPQVRLARDMPAVRRRCNKRRRGLHSSRGGGHKQVPQRGHCHLLDLLLCPCCCLCFGK